MLQQITSVNVTVRVIENIYNKFDMRLSERQKTIINILLSGIIYRDGCIVIASAAINQLNKITKERNIDLVNILIGLNCISHIDKLGAITIPISYLLNKLTISKELVSRYDNNKYGKKILTNATQTLCITELLSALGIPKAISITIVNIILELVYSDLENERKLLYDTSQGFKGRKLSETKKVLQEIQFYKIFVSTTILLVMNYIGLNVGCSLLLVNVLTELFNVFKVKYKEKHVKTFLSITKNIRV